MKFNFIIFYLLSNFLCTSIKADALSNLYQRLNKINYFYSYFYQKVTDNNNNNIQYGEGELWVSRPNQFNWHMIKPEENFIISNGQKLWIYIPLLKQVTVNSVTENIKNTPLNLIIQNKISDWINYDIKQQGNRFELIPKHINNNFFKIIINITLKGKVKMFKIIEKNGLNSVYKLTKQKNKKISSNKFTFIVPKGTTIDEQL
ncbi:outer membrane lipoprotein chaperone LolA [Pantoea sp. Mhis]|uniref:outer membrane lipoprotein chaperone LolA n=1 Tax=Pantoea sp. Mhis TaxID=2576759 RepID=UPI00135CD44C|nr:outer membrane lipoprotein chaperone LolA [Pantoea sp. Mhis]MXP56125.1 outer membrane lipoprotein chaperone LolA [Pantoea sp. Mhis]